MRVLVRFYPSDAFRYQFKIKTVPERDILPQNRFLFVCVTTPGVEPGDPKIIAPQATAFTNFAMWPCCAP